MPRKKQRQLSIGLPPLREYRLHALISCHQLLKHVNGFAVIVAIVLDWAVEQLQREMVRDQKYVPLQILIVNRLGEPGHSWSDEEDPAIKFAEEALLDPDQVREFIRGARPKEEIGEASGLASALGLELDDLLRLLRRQYEALDEDLEGGGLNGIESGSDESHSTD